MSKRPVNLTLEEGVLDYANKIMELRRFGTLVSLIEQLLREEWERRNGPAVLSDSTQVPDIKSPKASGKTSYSSPPRHGGPDNP